MEFLENYEEKSVVSDFGRMNPKLQPMIVHIEKMLPELNRARQFFGKTQSQFMDNFLTLSFPTPMRNIHQILAQIEGVRSALTENHFKLKKQNLKLKKKRAELETATDPFAKELLEIQIEEILAKRQQSEIYISGAVRRLANYTEQYEALLSSVQKDKKFDEVDFEEAEERYHIMRAFEQGLCAARSHGGIIDEGNQIYLFQIGINGTSAQMDVRNYLVSEAKIIEDSKGKNIPKHEDTLVFLDAMAQKYKGCSRIYAKHKGLISSEASMLTEK